MKKPTPPPADPYPELIVERGPEGKGVGSWVPRDKHRLLHEYLDGTRYAWQKWPNRVLIDPFAGPGRIQVAGENFTRDGGAVVAWRALAQDAPFTRVFVGDLEADRAAACEQRLRALGAPVRAFVGPAAETVPAMVAAVPSRALCLAYLDPYNLELLSYSMIEALAQLRNVDLVVNFSTMDLQRNVELELDPTRNRFDGTAPRWREQPSIVKANKQNTKLAFFEYWRGLVGALGFEHSEAMPLIYNDQGIGIYRMVFFARHKLPKRIWRDVARGGNPNLELF
ncbi:MAG: three-Cys-motif partner protein TcmP [Steroidobacteraceae bacterium]